MRKLDIKVGDEFGDWTVINIDIPSRNKARYIQCRCKCGAINEINASALRNGKSSSCKSCSARKRTTKLEVGSKYKHWTIIDGPEYINSTAYYKVRCDCGTEAYKLPIELLYKDKDFQCEKCAHKENMESIRKKNGEVGGLTKTEHTRLKRSAEKRGYTFEVSIEYLWNLFQEQKQICAITGDYIPNIKEASLDRIDSSKGYIEGNVQWVTQQANLSKHVMTMEQLYEFCRKVLNHANQQPSTPLTKCEGSETNS
jgi:hypothetical protein